MTIIEQLVVKYGFGPEQAEKLLRLIRNPCGDEAEGLLQDLSLRDALVDYQTATG